MCACACVSVRVCLCVSIQRRHSFALTVLNSLLMTTHLFRSPSLPSSSHTHPLPTSLPCLLSPPPPQGCFHANEVEGLTLVSRSGRRLQLGRGGCSNWFREEAPPGGYLAGAWSSFLNASAWDIYTITVGLLPAGSAIQLPFLQQVCL